MKKIIAGLALFAMVFGFAFSSVQASGEKFFINKLSPQGGPDMGVFFVPFNGTNFLSEEFTTWTTASSGNQEVFWTEARNAIATWANNNGYTGIVGSDVRNFSPILSDIARTGSYTDLQGIAAPMMGLLGQSTVASAVAAMNLQMSDVSGLSTALAGKLSSEVDGSITNEIELPTQTGNSGKFLTTNGSAASWGTAGTGTVTSVVAGTGLSGGTITSTGTISLPNTGTAATYSGVTTDAQGRVTAGTNRNFSNTPSRSIVTGTGATGFQVSSTKDAVVNYSVNIVTTANIGGNSDGTVVLEIAPTNSATAGDWVEIARVRNGQAITLALTLQSVQTVAGQVGGVIPAGYYAKLRSINNAGTPSYTFNSGQEVQL